MSLTRTSESIAEIGLLDVRSTASGKTLPPPDVHNYILVNKKDVQP